MKFLLTFITVFSLLINVAKAQEGGCSEGYSYLIFDAANDNVISETRSEKIRYPASLVKLMTLYLTFEALQEKKIKMDQVITISARGEEISNVNKINTLRLKEGDKMTIKEAIQGVIVKSFNESALTLAEAVFGDEWDFVRQMNLKAEKLGMINTSFRNSTGLHEEGQYTTSYDLARLVIAMRKNFPKYYPLFSLKEFEFGGTKYETHNHVLLDYKGAEGMKTGFTNAAGFNLISSAKKSDQRIVSVLLGCASASSRDDFTKDLLDRGFDNLSKKEQKDFLHKILKRFDYNSQSKKKPYYEEEKRFEMISE
jgi:D-alanyl-D-alanine carboxypeptidase